MTQTNRSLISLSPLDDDNREQNEYAKGEITKLLGAAKYQAKLPFSRREFITTLPQKQKGLSISGYQPKLSLAITDKDQLGVVEKGALFILKPSPDEFPNLAENEHASMLVMKKLGFEVPEFGLVRFSAPEGQETGNEELAYVIRRYDRSRKGDEAIHQEQLDAAMDIQEKYGKIKDDDESYVSYEQACLFLLDNVNSSLTFKCELFKRILTAYYLGNNDLHLRNFGLLHPKDMAPTLTPIYDYVSVAPYPEHISNESSLALPLLASEEGKNGSSNGMTAFCTYSGYDFITFGKNIGLSEKLAKKLINDTIAKEEEILSIYESSFMPAEHVNAIKEWIKSRTHYLQRQEKITL